MSRAFSIGFVSWMVTLMCLASQGTASPQVPKIQFEKFVLDNGLQVILHIDRKLPIAHVNLWFHVGSKNEKIGKTGLAHLFEHMMFQGSKNIPGKYLSEAEKIGANLREGGVNGTTDNDRTNYFITAPSGSLERLLWLESDRLSGLMDALTQAKLDNQRDVVKNERRQAYENVPYGRAHELIFSYLFPARHPYSWPVIGSMDDLTTATMDDVKEFFRTYYTPNNLTLTIAGDFDPSVAKTLVTKYFASIPPGPALARPARLNATLDADRVVEVSDRVKLSRVYLVWPTIPYFDAQEAPLDHAATILADGLSSRLQKSLVYDRQLCTRVQAYHMTLEISGGFVIDAQARPGGSLPEIEKIILAEVHRLATEGPSVDELARAKNKHEFEFIAGLERIGGFGGKADQLARYNTFLGQPDLFQADLDRYDSVTPSLVKETLSRFVDGKPRLTIRFHPEPSTRPAGEPPDRTKAPALLQDRPFSVPQVRTTTLANGLEIFVVENHELPKAAVRLSVRAGSSREDLEKAGLATLTSRVVDKGTKKRTALAIEDELAALGTRLSSSAGTESSALWIDVLKRNLSPAMEILADVVLQPTFPKAETDREKKKLLDELVQIQQDPGRVARRIMPLLAYGPNHPFGHPAQGSEDTVQHLTEADLTAFYKKFFQPANASLVFVGDLTLDEARGLAEKYFGAWTGSAVPPLAVPPPEPAAPGKIYLVDKQDAEQSVVASILPGTNRNSPDYYGLQIVDAIFGGAFGSRLNLNLREAKGYTYGFFSAPVFLSKAGTWYSFGGVQTKFTGETVTEVLKETKGLAGERPIEQKELTDAKANKVRGYSQSFESQSRISGVVADLWLQGRPMSDMSHEPFELERVSIEEANSVAKKYAVPAEVRFLVVGDRSKVEKTLSALGHGDVVLLDTMGRPKR